jgi:hypothetical protein
MKPATASNLPRIGKAVHFKYQTPLKPLVVLESEYSDPEIESDEDPEPFEPIHGFCQEYRSLIFSNSSHTEGQFTAISKGIRPLKRSHRSKVISWMIRINDEMQFKDETLLLAATLFDRVTAVKRLDRTELQLFASTCLWIASKIEETLNPSVSDFVYLCGGAYSVADFVSCEASIVNLLHFMVASTTSIVYVQAVVEAAGENPTIVEVASYFCFALMFCPSYGGMSPSVMGITAVVLAILILGTRTNVRGFSVCPKMVIDCWQEIMEIIGEIDDQPENPLCDAFPASAGRTAAEVREELETLVSEEAVRQILCLA